MTPPINPPYRARVDVQATVSKNPRGEVAAQPFLQLARRRTNP